MRIAAVPSKVPIHPSSPCMSNDVSRVRTLYAPVDAALYGVSDSNKVDFQRLFDDLGSVRSAIRKLKELTNTKKPVYFWYRQYSTLCDEFSALGRQSSNPATQSQIDAGRAVYDSLKTLHLLLTKWVNGFPKGFIQTVKSVLGLDLPLPALVRQDGTRTPLDPAPPAPLPSAPPTTPPAPPPSPTPTGVQPHFIYPLMALLGMRTPPVPSAPISSLTDTEVGFLDLRSLTSSQFSELSETQLSKLTAWQIKQFSQNTSSIPDGWTTDGKKQAIAALEGRITALSPAALEQLTYPIGIGITSDQIKALAAESKFVHLNADIHAFFFQHLPTVVRPLGAHQVRPAILRNSSYFTTEDIRGWTSKDIRRMTSEHFRILSDVDRIQFVDSAALAAATPEQLSQVNLNRLGSEQLQALGKVHVSALSETTLDGLTGVTLRNLGLDIQWVAPEKAGHLKLNELTDAQLAQLSKFHLQYANPSAVALLTPAQIKALGPDIGHLPEACVREFNLNQIQALEPLQVKALGKKLAALTGAKLMPIFANPETAKFVAKEAIVTLNSSQIKDLPLVNFTRQQLSVLQPGQLAEVTASQVQGVRDDQWRALGVAVSGLPPAAFSKVRLDILSLDQLRSLRAEQLEQVTGDQILGLSDQDIVALGSDSRGLSDAALRALSPAQVGALTPGQVASLPPAKFVALGSKVAYLTPEALSRLTASQMTQVQLNALSADQLALLWTDQVTGLTEAQINSLTASQKAALRPIKTHITSTAAQAALGS